MKTELRYPGSNEKFQMKVNWEKEAVSALLNSLKDNVPKATGALYDYVNKRHEEYTGLDLRDAALRVRRGLHHGAEQAYQEAMRQFDEVDKALGRAVRDTTQTYQRWNGEAQALYRDLLLDQEGQVDFQRLQNKVLDSLIGVTEGCKGVVDREIDMLMHYLKFTRFQVPGRAGTSTVDELCTRLMREVGKVLSQLHSKIYSVLEMLFSYFQDLMEKSELIKDLKIKFPFDSRSHKLTNVTLEYGKQLKSLSQEVQKVLNGLQANKTTEMLGELQKYSQNVFQGLEGEMTRLKEKKFTILMNEIQHKLNTTFSGYFQHVFRFLKENLYPAFGKFNELVQNKLQEASQEFEQMYQYVKALHKEYFDQKVVSWKVKYYELEEKIMTLIKNLLDGLKDFHSKYMARAADFVSQLSNEFEQVVPKSIQKYLSILADADGKRREKIVELSTSAQEIIKSWVATMKEIISDYHQQFTYKLEDFSNHLSDYYEKFIAESRRLIDLSIQKYHMLLSYITELLQDLQSATVNDMSPYIKVAPGEFIINF